MSSELDRRDFLNISAASLAGMALSERSSAQTSKPIRLGFVGVGNRGSYHLDCALGIEGVEVAALCDIDDNVLYRAKRWVEGSGQPSPHLYGDSRNAFKALCEKETLDCVICCTPWEYHTQVCVAAMTNGKNAVSEVPIVITVEEAWQIVETYEKTKKWATMGLEGFGDLTLINMVRKGLFGDVIHTEGGYVHDLRMVKYNPIEEPWRLQHSVTRNGNLYPDHPMARIMPLMDINHGDRFDYLVSMSSKATMLNRYAALKYGERSPYATSKVSQGDVNVTLLHTAGGKMVTLNFDTETPHPREFFRMQGSKGVYQTAATPREAAVPGQTARAPGAAGGGRAALVYLEGRTPIGDERTAEPVYESAAPYMKEFQHPYLASYKPKPRKSSLRGHGGGGTTTPVNWDRLIAALRNGRMPDWDVYDSVTSSAIGPLSEKSVAGGSIPVQFPDFTKGKFQSAKPIVIE